jgi:hypothetical protein
MRTRERRLRVLGSALLVGACAVPGGLSAQSTCTTLGTQTCAPVFTDLGQFPTESAEVVEHGIMTGCAGNLFCPTAGVTRGDMAVYLENAKHLGQVYSLPAAQGVFADVPVGFPLACWVEQIKADGITNGCATSPLRYCPETLVTRMQMAFFMLKAKEGGGYTPPACQGTFEDVPCTGTNSSFAPYVEELARRCITTGCGCNNQTHKPLFCPGSTTTKDAMAAFMSRMVLAPITCTISCP